LKHKIRCEVHEAKKGHSAREIAEKSKAIAERLFRLPEYKKAKTIMFYASKKLEVQTLAVIKMALREKNVAVPLVKGDDMTAIQITGIGELVPGAFGVPEPRRGPEIRPKDIDLVIVPGVAFDAKGNRVGYGKGYYDKYLKKTIRAQVVALAYEFQISPRVPAECHDVRVHKIITEKRTVSCAG
jgi:5-formyltetrahydrofolate cyclo-ligase